MGYRKNNQDGPSSEDKALDLFAEMMIQKIEEIKKDWRKPWFTDGALTWPKNMAGREYNGLNALMCAHALRGQRIQDTPVLYV